MIDAKDFDFSGRRILVTGAASGIGAAMAAAFKAHGGEVVLADRDSAGLEAQAQALGGAATHVYDQAELASIGAMVRAVGRVDILLNNAGINIVAPLLSLSPEQISRVLTIDLIGPIVLARLVAEGMIARGKGVIVNTASQLAFCGSEQRAPYVSAKAGLVQFTRAAAREWAPWIRVVALGPGRTLTPLTADSLATEEQRQAGLARIPAGRYGTAEEMARFAVFLASDLADYITGETLVADGGYVTV